MPGITSLPLDLTGVNPDNLITNEIHILDVRKVRSIVLTNGPFYKESLIIVDNITGIPLVDTIDYVSVDLIAAMSAQTGKEIYATVCITNTSVNNIVRVSYQALGGTSQYSFTPIKQLLDALTKDTRPVNWPNIINRPFEVYPTSHLHATGDLMGFEYLIVELEQIRNALLLGDDVGHAEILSYVDSCLSNLLTDPNNRVTDLTNLINSYKTNIDNAITNLNNYTTQIAALQTELNNRLGEIDNISNNIRTSEARSRDLLNQYNIEM